VARGVNKVILIGNLGRDPETRYLPSGGAVTNVALATSESWTDKQSGQKQERTEWHRVVFFNRLAEIAGEYLKKGTKVYIEGSLRTRKWQDQQTGQDRYSTEIVASEMQMLDTRGGPSGGGDGYSGYDQIAPPSEGSHGASQASASKQAGASSPGSEPAKAASGGFDDSFDDDIPF